MTLVIHPDDFEPLRRLYEASARRQGYSLTVPVLPFAEWARDWRLSL